VPVELVSAQLGRANVSITWNRYRHLPPGALDEGRDTYDAYLRAPARLVAP
jgi:hypothetical protein